MTKTLVYVGVHASISGPFPSVFSIGSERLFRLEKLTSALSSLTLSRHQPFQLAIEPLKHLYPSSSTLSKHSYHVTGQVIDMVASTTGDDYDDDVGIYATSLASWLTPSTQGFIVDIDDIQAHGKKPGTSLERAEMLTACRCRCCRHCKAKGERVLHCSGQLETHRAQWLSWLIW